MPGESFRAVAVFALILTMLAAGGCCPQADSPRVLDATDPAAIASATPTVIVTGLVVNTQEDDGVLMINFKGTEKSRFYAVILSYNRDAMDAAFGGSLSKAVTGKSVRVTGKVTIYRGRPEIVISKASQLTVDNS
jgi:hypothetical protein